VNVLRARVRRALREFDLDVELDAEPGRTLVLVGESGAGKTTLLRLIAGLDEPDEGHVEVDGEVWCDAAKPGLRPAHRRDAAYVFQDYALFPHLSVARNVAYGLEGLGLARAEIGRRTGEMLQRLGIETLAGARPAALSGGQQQRVALARALVLEPRVLLLDEPLSALDLPTRRSVRAELRAAIERRAGVTLFVTHSPFEAMAFGERIGVLERGRIVQLGDRDDLLRHPRSRYVAELMGVNFLRGRAVAATADGLAEVHTEHGAVHVLDVAAGEDVFIAVDPRAITLHLEPPSGTAQNVLRGPIVEIAPEPPYGERVRVVLGCEPPLVAEVTAHAVETLGLRPGLEIFASFKASAARTYR